MVNIDSEESVGRPSGTICTLLDRSLTDCQDGPRWGPQGPQSHRGSAFCHVAQPRNPHQHVAPAPCPCCRDRPGERQRSGKAKVPCTAHENAHAKHKPAQLGLVLTAIDALGQALHLRGLKQLQVCVVLVVARIRRFDRHHCTSRRVLGGEPISGSAKAKKRE